MFIPFLYELRARKVPVGTQEAVALAKALSLGLHEDSLDGFYYVARALCVHNEAHLDAFDEAFASHFKGVESNAIELKQQLFDWLKDAKERVRRADRRGAQAVRAVRPEPSSTQMFEERLREQNERHDGGTKWIGTGGKSPFGNSGAPRPGIRVGGAGGNRSAVRVAGERAYRSYRNDVTLDTRQAGVALRKLRAFIREGAQEELDLDGTIDATAKNAGELEVIGTATAQAQHARHPDDGRGRLDGSLRRAGVAPVQRGQQGHALQGAALLLLPQRGLRPGLQGRALRRGHPHPQPDRTSAARTTS